MIFHLTILRTHWILQIAAGFNVLKGNLLAGGLIVMAFCQLLAQHL
jgi:hypothetical protein